MSLNPGDHRSGERVDFDPFSGGRLLRTGSTTDAQREILAVARMGREAGLAYSEAIHLTFQGPVSTEAIDQGLRQIVHRHEALRTTFSRANDAFFVWDREIEVRRVSVGEDEADSTLRSLLAEAVEVPFDLDQGPLFRATLLVVGPERCDLVLAVHHLACDGWSLGVLVRELAHYYRHRSESELASLPEPPAFSAYAEGLRRGEGDESATASLRFWRRAFSGSVPVLDLPTDRRRPDRVSFRSKRVDMVLGAEEVVSLRSLASALGVSFFGVLLTGFYALVARLTGANDIVVAVPSAGQLASGMEGLVGHCVNVLPVRSIIELGDPFSKLAATVNSRASESFEHQNFTLGRLLRTVSVQRDPARRPAASVMFNLDRAIRKELSGFEGVQVRVRSIPRVSEYFEIFLNAVEEGDRVVLECQYNSDLFDGPTVEGWLDSFKTFLASAASDPTRPSLDLTWLSEPAIAVITNEWQGPTLSLSSPLWVPDLVAAQAIATPDACAVRSAGGELSYRDLVDRAAALSLALREQGVGVGSLVGLCVSRSESLPIAILGVMGSGATYLPLDLRYPPARLRQIVADSAPSWIVTDRKDTVNSEDWLVSNAPPKVLSMDELELGADRQIAPPPPSSLEGHVAYLMYTSGSTGAPKGVRVFHTGVTNFLLGMRHLLDVGPGDTLLALTTLSFDISVLELFLPLVTGATVAILDEESARDPARIAEALEEFDVNVMQATPSTWATLIERGWAGSPGLLALAGGEVLSADLASQLGERVRELWNMYGPTETTVWSACHRVEGSENPVPLGSPIANTVIHVLDPGGRPVPIGAPGEICIGGAGVSGGYLNREELTADRFRNDSPAFFHGSYYRTGDLGRWGSDGQLRFLGRLDDQVKIRGHRVELGDVEAAMQRHPGVKAAVAAIQSVEDASPRLIAFFEAKEPPGPVPREIRGFLVDLLPEQMIPQHIARIDAIPRSPGGKLNRSQLPRASFGAPEEAGSRTAPIGEEELWIAGVWSEVLGVSNVCLEDNFFELGGHSILAARVVARIDRHFGTDVGLRSLFEVPRLGDWILRVCDARGAGRDDLEEIVL